MSEGAGAQPQPLRHLALRSAGLFVLSTCGFTAGLLIWDFIHRTHFESLNNFPEFTGWQLSLTGVAIGLLAVALGTATVATLRRHPLPRDVPRSSRIVWAVVAITLGAIVGDISDLGTKHTLDWASSHTAAAARSRAQDAAVRLQMLGDATHLPMPFTSDASPPPSFATTPLLRPADLGPDWHLQGPLRGSYPAPRFPDSPPGIRSESATNIAQERWNGREWVLNNGLFETARRFTSPELARAAQTSALQSVRISTTPSMNPPGRLHRLRIRGKSVWRQDPVSPSYPDDRYFVVVGSTELNVFIVALTPGSTGQPVLGPIPTFTPITARHILAAAIKRAEGSG